ncbi:hypothetical protein D7147_13945 [Micromonospora musae]|uniref:Uncharacterized protein n=1 Tax=Micromonospora musae TaxID=1894970 RepID=A0A3A9Y090_9ACTN|nr:hypothetical protein D7147_13945 [Micromonospora musae]RKN30073.1 hypothetical protein D7044_21040 [Micromonospora musae]
MKWRTSAARPEYPGQPWAVSASAPPEANDNQAERIGAPRSDNSLQVRPASIGASAQASSSPKSRGRSLVWQARYGEVDAGSSMRYTKTRAPARASSRPKRRVGRAKTVRVTASMSPSSTARPTSGTRREIGPAAR